MAIADSKTKQDEKIKILEGTINELQDRIKTLESTSRGSAHAIKKMATDKPKLTTPTVTVDSKKVQFKLASFRFNGIKYISQEVAKDKDLLKKLMKECPSVFLTE